MTVCAERVFFGLKGDSPPDILYPPRPFQTFNYHCPYHCPRIKDRTLLAA